VPRPKKYLTEQERREAIRQGHRKYVEANRVAIRARQAERDRKRRAPIKAGRRRPRQQREEPPRQFSRDEKMARGLVDSMFFENGEHVRRCAVRCHGYDD
jgi:hypothetical protein